MPIHSSIHSFIYLLSAFDVPVSLFHHEVTAMSKGRPSLSITFTDKVGPYPCPRIWLEHLHDLLLCVYLNFQGSVWSSSPMSCLASTSNSMCLELNLPSSSPHQFFLLTSLFHQWYLHFPVTRHKISETPNCFLFLSPNTSPSSVYSSSFWINTFHVCHFLS